MQVSLVPSPRVPPGEKFDLVHQTVSPHERVGSGDETRMRYGDETRMRSGNETRMRSGNETRMRPGDKTRMRSGTRLTLISMLTLQVVVVGVECHSPVEEGPGKVVDSILLVLNGLGHHLRVEVIVEKVIQVGLGEGRRVGREIRGERRKGGREECVFGEGGEKEERRREKEGRVGRMSTVGGAKTCAAEERTSMCRRETAKMETGVTEKRTITLALKYEVLKKVFIGSLLQPSF